MQKKSFRKGSILYGNAESGMGSDSPFIVTLRHRTNVSLQLILLLPCIDLRNEGEDRGIREQAVKALHITALHGGIYEV